MTKGKGTRVSAWLKGRGPWAPLLACMLAFGGCLGASTVSAQAAMPDADGASVPARSAGGSALGILLNNTPSLGDIEGGKYMGNDSYLGILVAAAVGEEVSVTFMLDENEPYESVSVPWGGMVPRPESPKRPGWQLPEVGGWVTEDGEAWDFGSPVTGDLTLYARWDLRLDVTVPVSVAFAVDASTGEALGPEPGRYALKSRTVREVEVESLALESRQEELEAFFALAEGAGWEATLAETELSLAPAGADAIGLPLAGERQGGLWRHERPIKAEERDAWRMSAFDYGALAADGAWEGGDPSVKLPLALALSISDDLEVLTGQEGPVPITRLKVTVSAKG